MHWLVKPTRVVGSGVLVCEKELAAGGRNCRIVKDEVYFYPRLDGLAPCAWARIQRGDMSDPLVLEPLYLHPRDCNVTRSDRTTFQRERLERSI